MSVLTRRAILATVVLLLIACRAIRGEQQFINREEAIAIALQIARAPQPELSGSLTEPTNVQAERMRLIDVVRRLEETTELGPGSHDNETVVWLVTMEGTWTVEFPRQPDAPEPEQEPYHHYTIILDATSGSPIMVWGRP